MQTPVLPVRPPAWPVRPVAVTLTLVLVALLSFWVGRHTPDGTAASAAPGSSSATRGPSATDAEAVASPSPSTTDAAAGAFRTPVIEPAVIPGDLETAHARDVPAGGWAA